MKKIILIIVVCSMTAACNEKVQSIRHHGADTLDNQYLMGHKSLHKDRDGIGTAD